MSQFAPRLARRMTQETGVTLTTTPLTGIDYDAAATAHYRFGTGNSGLTDARGENALVKLGSDPTLNATSMTIASGAGNGIRTPFADRSRYSAIIVVRATTSGTNQNILGWTGSTSNVGLHLLNNPTNAARKYFILRGNTGNVTETMMAQPAGLVDGTTWVTLSITARLGAGSMRCLTYVGDEAATDAQSLDSTGGTPALSFYRDLQDGYMVMGAGSGLYTAFSGAVEVASLLYYDFDMSETELRERADQEKAWLSTYYGLTVV